MIKHYTNHEEHLPVMEYFGQCLRVICRSKLVIRLRDTVSVTQYPSYCHRMAARSHSSSGYIVKMIHNRFPCASAVCLVWANQTIITLRQDYESIRLDDRCSESATSKQIESLSHALRSNSGREGRIQVGSGYSRLRLASLRPRMPTSPPQILHGYTCNKG